MLSLTAVVVAPALDPREAQSICLGRLIRGGGIIFLDDYQLPSAARAASFCITILGWRYCHAPPKPADPLPDDLGHTLDHTHQGPGALK